MARKHYHWGNKCIFTERTPQKGETYGVICHTGSAFQMLSIREPCQEIVNYYTYRENTYSNT